MMTLRKVTCIMQIYLFNTKKLIDENNLKPVTDPMLFIRGAIPSPNGLLSNEIFGMSVKERTRTFAYIDLHGHYLHPFIYKLLKRLNRNFEHIIHSSKKYVIIDGTIVEDEENGETGIEFLYKNWEKLDFKKNDSLIRGERIDVITNYKKDELFTEYWLVIPAFYRDVNLQNMGKGKLSHNPINDIYSKLIRLTNLVSNGQATFDFTLAATKASIQECLVEIYDYLKGKVEKKTGLIRKNLLGKSIDYGARMVISAPTFHAETPEDMHVNIEYTGVPLAQCCSLFNPFIVAWVKNFFRRTFETSGGKIVTKLPDGKLVQLETDSPETYFNDEYIKKRIDSFIRAHETRFDIIYVPVKDSVGLVPFTYTSRSFNKDENDMNAMNRPMTWCDLLYQAAVDVTADKMVSISRYPISDSFSFFNTKVHVVSTKETVPMTVGDHVYDTYPKIDLNTKKENISSLFIDTLVMSNLYLKGLGGDYDGDQVSIRGLFTQEANEQARNMLMSKNHYLNSNGVNMRESSNESIQTLYTLTKEP